MTLPHCRPHEYARWHQDARDAFDERVFIASDGGEITENMIETATDEAMKVQARIEAVTETWR